MMLLRQMLKQAKNEGLTINVRHAKVLFCGASHAGKTSFCRLLRNKKHESVYESTPVGESQQVLISGKISVDGSNWINLDGKAETEHLTKRLILKLQNQKDTVIDKPLKKNNSDIKSYVSENKLPVNNTQSTKPKHANNTAVTQPNVEFPESIPEHQFFAPLTHKKSSTLSDSERQSAGDALQRNRRIVIEDEMVNSDVNRPISELVKSTPETWDLFTLLDTGGQPEFINMLPAINTSTAITFIVLNMSNGKAYLHDSVIAQYKGEGYNYTKCTLNYTNMHLLKCLLSSVKVAAMKKENLHPVIIKKLTEGEQCQPVVCIIGTCADVLKEKLGDDYNDEICRINTEVRKLVEPIMEENLLIFWCEADGNFIIPVDNTISKEPQNIDPVDLPQKVDPINLAMKAIQLESIKGNTIENVKRIRENSTKVLQRKAQYEIPISWFILELELRSNDKVCIPLTEVQDICDRIMPRHRRMNLKQIVEVLKFYHLLGMLLYFDEVDGMKNFVITNPQWLFINLTKIIMCRFKDKANDLFGAHQIGNMRNGICNIELLRRLKLDLQGIELESFIKLLVHLKVIAPMKDSEYFMPTLLPLFDKAKIFNEKEYGTQAAYLVDGQQICPVVEPLLIEFTFGTIPRGLFGFLVVQLLQNNPDKYELYGSNDHILCRCADLVTFYIKPCWYVSLFDRISYLELQVRVKGNKRSYHYEVQIAVTKALKQVCDEFKWKFSDCRYGFLCHEHAEDSYGEHLTLLSTSQPIPYAVPEYTSCRHHQSMDVSETHRIWFEVCIL